MICNIIVIMLLFKITYLSRWNLTIFYILSHILHVFIVSIYQHQE